MGCGRLVGRSTCALVMLFAWNACAQSDAGTGASADRRPLPGMAVDYYSVPASPPVQPRNDATKQAAPALPSSGPPWIMGMSESMAVGMSGDPYGNAFTHDHGDIANRWSHATVAAMVRESLRGVGVQGLAATLIGASVFVPKEMLIDQNPSASDFVVDFELYRQTSGRSVSSMSVTVFGDGAVFLGMWRTF